MAQRRVFPGANKFCLVPPECQNFSWHKQILFVPRNAVQNQTASIEKDWDILDWNFFASLISPMNHHHPGILNTGSHFRPADRPVTSQID